MNKKKIISMVVGAIALIVALFFGVNINSKDAQGKPFVDLGTGGQALTTNNLLGMVSPQNYTVYVTKSGKKYHTSECRYVLGKQIPISRQEAVNEGYEPCRRCKPDGNAGTLIPQTTTPQNPETQTEREKQREQERQREDDIILE